MNNNKNSNYDNERNHGTKNTTTMKTTKNNLSINCKFNLGSTFNHQGDTMKNKKNDNDNKKKNGKNNNTTKKETNNDMSIDCKINLKVHANTRK